MKYHSITINGYKARIQTWNPATHPTHYSAQAFCPVKGCLESYRNEHRVRESDAKAAAIAELKKHMNSKHVGKKYADKIDEKKKKHGLK